ncbi:MAG: DUF86 domain-containing protein [Burkholderiales bacterium]|nr:DUF86 domain-containing protein [Burkholderiales bacterium]
MDRDIIARKLEQLRRHVARVESKKPFGPAELAHDEDLRDVVVFNLVQAVETWVDIGMHLLSETEVPPPESMGEVFDRLRELSVFGDPARGLRLANRLKRAVGFRNVPYTPMPGWTSTRCGARAGKDSRT